MKAEVFEGLAGLAHCEADWRALQAQRSVPAHHLEYDVVHAALTWLDDAPEQNLIVRVSDAGVCVALLRLAPRERRIFRMLRVRALEVPTYTEFRYQDLLLLPGSDAAAVWSALGRALAARGQRWDALTSLVAPDGGGFEALAASLPWRARVVGGMVGFEQALHFDTRHSHVDLSARFAPLLTKNLAIGWRRVRRTTDWELLCVPGEAAQLWAFDELCRVESSGWKGPSGSDCAIGFSGPVWEFNRALFLLRSPRCRGEMHLLRIDGAVVAALLCLVVGRARFALKQGFDAAQRRFGAGQLLLDETLQLSCADPDIDELNLVGNETWLRDWHADGRPVHDYMLLRNRALALGWQFLAGLRRRLRGTGRR
ncbi:MAG: GNAT family N-acetyltransferase [Burkholderiales bacterium]